MKKLHSGTVLLILALNFVRMDGLAQYTINDTFADPAECTYMTRDASMIWWDQLRGRQTNSMNAVMSITPQV